MANSCQNQNEKPLVGCKRHFWVSSIPPPLLAWCWCPVTPFLSLAISIILWLQHSFQVTVSKEASELQLVLGPEMCSMLRSLSHPRQKPQHFPLPSLSPLPAPSLLCLHWEQVMSPHTAERAWLMGWGWQKENPRFGAGPGSDHVFFCP